MRKKYWLAGLLILCAGILWYVYLQYQRTNQDLRREKADLTINAEALIREFETSDSLADKKYRKRILAVRGIVKQVDTSGNSLSIILTGQDSTAAVRFSMDGDAQEFSDIHRGMPVTIQGILNGISKDPTGLLGDEIVFNRGVRVTDPHP